MTFEEYYEKFYNDDHETYYIIDFLPCMPRQDDFVDYMDYMEEYHEMEFASKIANIILKLIYSYNCEVRYGEDDGDYLTLDKYDIPRGVNIRDIGPKKLIYLIKMVIMYDYSSATIYFKDEGFSMVIARDFNVTFYYMPKKFESVMKLLAEQEGLFLKYKPSENEDFVLI